MSPPSFLLLSLTIFLSSLHTFVDANHLIQQTCKNCSKNDPNISYKFCTTSLQSDHRTHCAKNLTQLGLISIKLTRHNISDTCNHIKGLLKKEGMDSFIKECLEDCLEVYSDSFTTFREAIRDYKAKRYADANVKLSSVLDASTTCEDGFKQKDINVNSPLTKRNENAFQLSAIALSIVNMLNVDYKLKGVF